MNIIDEILSDYKSIIGKDYTAYRNHVQRLYALCLEMDASASPAQEEKYAIAAVFHDIGIWTANTFDYLAPSIELARKYLAANQKSAWAEEVSLMIDMHHKSSSYKGVYATTVETFRRADWQEVTMGKLAFGLDKKVYRLLKQKFPYQGFHWFLARQTLKHWIKQPLNPLPMFRR